MIQRYRPYLIRLLITSVIALVFVGILNEGFYLLQREQHDRAPRTVQIVVPIGTAERIAAGEAAVSLPEEMVFVVGDTLEVVNQDSVQHELGPIWVPAGSTGRLVLEEANKFAFSCTFAPGNYLGLDVRLPTTLGTRLTALALSAPPMAVFLFIYGLLAFPIKDGKKKKTLEAGA